MKTMKWAVRFCAMAALLLLLMMGATPATAQTLDEALAAYKRKDYASAWRGLLVHADRGNAVAQYNLGLMYTYSMGIPRDYTEPLKWFLLAAAQGNVRAQQQLAAMYGRGMGVPRDEAEAVKWYRRAAEGGNAYAQTKLGAVYMMGHHGVPRDLIQAHKWFSLAISRLPVSAEMMRYSATRGRDEAASLMRPEELSRAQRLMRKWRPRIWPYTSLPRE